MNPARRNWAKKNTWGQFARNKLQRKQFAIARKKLRRRQFARKKLWRRLFTRKMLWSLKLWRNRPWRRKFSRKIFPMTHLELFLSLVILTLTWAEKKKILLQTQGDQRADQGGKGREKYRKKLKKEENSMKQPWVTTEQSRNVSEWGSCWILCSSSKEDQAMAY